MDETSNLKFGSQSLTQDKTEEANPDSCELPVREYLERLSNSLDDFSNRMSINPEVWERGTIDSKDSWEKLNDWFTAIDFKEQPKDVNVPYWGRVDMPTLEELGDLENKDFTTKDVISRLFFVSSVLNVDVEYQDKENQYSEESMKFGELIADVYPGLESGMRDIQEQLELAVTDPKKFERLFGPKDNKGRSLRELFLSRSKEITATSAVALMILLSGCATPSEQADHTPIVQTLEQDEEEATPTPSLTPTQTQTATPTQTPTATITASPTEENYIPWEDSWAEGMEKFGYQFGVAPRMTKESSFEWEDGLMVVTDFTYEEYDITHKGNYLLGNINFNGGNYPFKLLVDEGISYYAAGSSANTMDIEVIEKFMKEGKSYYIFTFIIRKDTGELVQKPDYNNEEWKETRDIVEKLFVSGGENEEYYFLLNYIELNR